MADQPFVLKLLCLRHGKTAYSGKFPDLTEEGEAHIREVAEQTVKAWMSKNGIGILDLSIFSSPAPRAHGTAHVVSEVIGSKPIILCKGLDAMEWRDRERALLACDGFKGKGYIDYETEPVFADPTIFETPEEVRRRGYAFFCEHIVSAWKMERPQHSLMFSHYEVFSPFTRDFFGVIASKDTALQYGEPIELTVSIEHPAKVMLSGRFRNLAVQGRFDLETYEFVSSRPTLGT